jgi:hypothetical protein
MSNVPANFTPEQWSSINNSIEQSKKDVIDATSAKVVELIRANQQQIIKAVEENIVAALNANQRVIIATEHNGVNKKAVDSEETRKWKVFMVALPIILSTILGLMIFNAQQRIQKDVSDKSENLKTQLALMQEFYSKKLGVYEEIHKQIASLVDSLQSVQINPESVGKASENLRAVNQAYKINNLYLSNELAEQLKALWELGIEMPALRPTGKATMGEILGRVSLIEAQMKKDLQVNEIGEIGKIIKSNRSP